MSIETIILAQNLTTVSTDSSFSYTNKTPGPGYYKQDIALRTVAYDLIGFVGTVKLQASLERYPGRNDWFDITDTDYVASSARTSIETLSFSGNFVWLRAAYNLQSGQINRIAVNGITIVSSLSNATFVDLGAFEFNGSVITTSDSTAITVDNVLTANSDLYVGGDILPLSNIQVDLGSAAARFRDLYLSSNTIYLGATTLGVDSQGNLLIGGQAVADVGTAAWANITGKPTFATVATSGSYADLSNKPTIPTNLNDLANVNTIDPANGDFLMYANGEWVNAVILNNIVVGSNVSLLNNDAGYITAADIADGTLTIDVNNTGDLKGSVFGDDSTLLVDATNSSIPYAVLSGAPSIPTDINDLTDNTNLLGSNPFDQDLNSTDNPQFNRVGLTAGEINVVPGTDFNLYTTPDGVTSHNLNFGTDGTLTTPALNVTGRLTAFNIQPVDAVPGEQAVNSYIRAQTATTPFAGSFPGGNLYLEAGLSYAGNIAGNIYIGTTETSAVTIGSGSVTVTSDLLLGPASTAAPVLSTTVNGQNGIAMDLRIDAGTDSGVTGNVTISGDTVNLQGTVDLSNASIVGDIRSEGDIAIDINLSDSTLRRWKFTEGGQFETAGSVIVNGGVQFPGVGTISGDDVVPSLDLEVVEGGDITLLSGNYTWKFGGDGILTIPLAISAGRITSDSSLNLEASTIVRIDALAGGDVRLGSNAGGQSIKVGNTTTQTIINGNLDLSNANIAGGIRSESNIDIDINLSDSTLRRWRFGEDGNLNLAGNLQFPNGAEIRDVNGDLRLRAAPGDVAQLQGLTTDGAVDAAVKAFHDIETGSYVTINTNIDAGAPEHVWTFDYNGELTFPDNTVQSTAWTGGRVVSVPTTSLGTTGDLAGDLAFNATYMYYCTQNFSGTVININSITSSGILRAFIIMYDSNTGWTSADLTGYTVTGPSSYTGTVTGPSQDQGGGLWYIPVSPDITQAMGTYTFTSPGGDIWKRIAWSGDTW